MIRFDQKSQFCPFRFLTTFCIILSFCLNLITLPYANAQSTLDLPAPGTFVTTSPVYTPAIVAGITIYPQDPLKFDFIIDVGDDNLQGEELSKESQKLINYFMATLTVPEDEMWVNLSPHEKDRIMADGLGQTVMGKDMLAQDYILKQLTASMLYPENEPGNEFWQRTHEKAQKRFDTTKIPTNTFNKIWIVPEEAVIYANGANIFITDSRLKVMLEEDYLSLEHHDKGLYSEANDTALREETKAILREIIVPEIEKEINEGKNFATLRQIYHSMILATWYKNNLKESLLGKVYVNQNKTNGIEVEDKEMANKIYNQYVEAFKKGVYNYIKEDYDPSTQQIIPRKYFSGGVDAAMLTKKTSDTEIIPQNSWIRKRMKNFKIIAQTKFRLHSFVSHVNNILLPPPFSSIAAEKAGYEKPVDLVRATFKANQVIGMGLLYDDGATVFDIPGLKHFVLRKVPYDKTILFQQVFDDYQLQMDSLSDLNVGQAVARVAEGLTIHKKQTGTTLKKPVGDFKSQGKVNFPRFKNKVEETLEYVAGISQNAYDQLAYEFSRLHQEGWHFDSTGNNILIKGTLSKHFGIVDTQKSGNYQDTASLDNMIRALTWASDVTIFQFDNPKIQQWGNIIISKSIRAYQKVIKQYSVLRNREIITKY